MFGIKHSFSMLPSKHCYCKKKNPDLIIFFLGLGVNQTSPYKGSALGPSLGFYLFLFVDFFIKKSKWGKPCLIDDFKHKKRNQDRNPKPISGLDILFYDFIPD